MAFPLMDISPVPVDKTFNVPLKPTASPVPLPTPAIVIATLDAEEVKLIVDALETSWIPNKTPVELTDATLLAFPSNSILPAFASIEFVAYVNIP